MHKVTIYNFCGYELGKPRLSIGVAASSLREASTLLESITESPLRWSLIASPTTYVDSLLIAPSLRHLDETARREGIE